MKTATEILEAAKARIVEQGWCQRAFFEIDGQYMAYEGDELEEGQADRAFYCARGAIKQATKQLHAPIIERQRAEYHLASVIREHYARRRMAADHAGLRADQLTDATMIVEFNDDPQTEQHEVIAVFEKAIARSEELVT